MKEKSKEGMYLGMTLARLVQVPQLYKCIRDGKSITKTVFTIIGIDLADGIGARRDGVDGPKRRALDSMVDSGIIVAGLTAVSKKVPKARSYAGLLAAREVFVGAGWAIDLAKSKQVKKGDNFHKLSSLSIAAFALGATSGNKKALHATGLLAAGINMALAYDYYRGWTQPERNVVLDTGVVEVPGFYEVRNTFKAMRHAQLAQGSNTCALETPQEPIKLPAQSILGVIDLKIPQQPQLLAGPALLQLGAPSAT